MKCDVQLGFHAYYDAKVRPYKLYSPTASTKTVKKHFIIQERELSYRFYAHFHPYVTQLISRLIKKSVRALQDADTDYTDATFPAGHRWAGERIPKLYEELFTSSLYNPTDLVEKPYPVKDLDFTSGGAYSGYNWELFYHVPLTIAIHLSKNQRFQDAQRWLHYIFDPTDDSEGDIPERFWKVRSFHYTDVELIEDLLINLSTGADPELRQQTINSIGAWKDAPFRPHVIARYRQSAFMFKAVMTYLDNLVAWGDSLFRQDTRESVNEATQLYVLAANILGPRPQAVPKKGSVRPQTYANFRSDLSRFGNVMREMETDIPFDMAPHPTDASDNDRLATLRSIGNALYFCVPRNDKLVGYWDTVADRLFKIRNSLNIRGIFRQLPLFEPPIDPALLAKAAAAGLDVGAILAGLNQPLPLVRFQFLIQKATEICQEVKSLGANMLAALEKEDNEALAILRAKHERVILEATEAVLYGRWQEAVKSREALQISLGNAAERYFHYEKLLGSDVGDIELAELDELDSNAFEKMSLTTTEPEVALRNIENLIEADLSGEAGSRKLSSEEAIELLYLKAARGNLNTAADFEKVGAALGVFMPQPSISISIFIGSVSTPVPPNFSELFRFIASFYRTDAEKQSYEANKFGKLGSYSRREQDWAFQSNLAGGEITLLYKQIRAAQIREAVAECEWKNHQQQIKHAEEIEQFLTDERKGKKTNQAFYVWMKRELKGLYGQCYEFAFDIAKKAERALQHELGNPDLSYLQFGYLAGKEGLLAGEKMYLDLKRMEMAYHDLNQREYELTKNVSLLQLDPTALILLRATGRCTVTLPEELFDLDCPGHYFRRIKSLALSIPAVTGPNVSVNCTLTLLKSSVRKTPRLDGGGYVRSSLEDDRFDNHFGSLRSIVTSTGQGDSGLFETNLSDERFLPFEGSGVLSEWQLQLPASPSDDEPQQFDYNTITDVVLHVRYTAREGGQELREGALANLADKIETAQTVGSKRLFSVRHEFPGEWAKFKSAAAQNGWYELMLPLRAEHYPFWSKGRLAIVTSVDLVARTAENRVKVADQADEPRKEDTLEKDGTFGKFCFGSLSEIPLPDPVTNPAKGPFTLYLDDVAVDDLWLVVNWGKV